MITLERLLRLAGRPLLEKLSYEDAAAIFGREGEYPSGLDAAGLKQAWVRLQRKYHEAGQTPDQRKAQAINAAYDVLKAQPGAAATLGGDSCRYTIWGWDGRRMMRGETIDATPQQFPALARQAMEGLRQGFRAPTAIFLQAAGERWEVLLIHHAGRDIAPPRTFEHQGNGDPNSDPLFLADLVRRLNPNGKAAAPKAAEPAPEDTDAADRLDRLRDKMRDEKSDKPNGGVWGKMSAAWKRKS